jgi:serine protease Do
VVSLVYYSTFNNEEYEHCIVKGVQKMEKIKSIGQYRWMNPAVFLLLITVGVWLGIFQGTSLAVGKPGVPDNFSELAAEISPSVVNIRIEKAVKGSGRVFRHFFDRLPENDPFHDFFGGRPRHQQPDTFRQRSLGSGFVIDKEGFIVTNNHVVEGADKIKVKLYGGDEYDAEIVGRDPNTDLALIKIKPDKPLPELRLGNSDDLKIGQWVAAIGSPFGLENTLTVGIVSAKGRVIGSGPYDDFIQTDASINPGNSGGPLVNMKGEVIGINTAIIAGGQGIGFAVPISMATGVIDQLKDDGEVSRGWLGVSIQDLNQELAEYYGLDSKKGVLVTEAFEDDPAAEAGMETNDIILSVNGKEIKDSRELSRIIADIGVGERAKIVVLRKGKEKKFTVKLAKRPDAISTQTGRPESQEDEYGIRVAQITPEVARRYRMDVKDGVVVTQIKPGSKSENAGLRAGDIVKEVNHRKIKTVADFKKAIKNNKKDDPIQLFVWRPNRGFVVIRLAS